MVKVSIKKNVKPKKIKKTAKPKKKVLKEKKLTQTQSITVNIQKNRRGVANKKQLPINKPIQQAITPLQSTAPTIKLSNQLTTPSSLTSSILASQEKPDILAKELKDQSALTKALIEQNTETEEPKVNDLERVRIKKEPVELKQKKQFEEAYKINDYESKAQIRYGLLSQLLSEQGDDTEEINKLISESKTGGLLSPDINIPIPFKNVSVPNPLSALSNPLSGVSIPKLSNPLTKIANKANSLTDYLLEKSLDTIYGKVGEEEEEPPIEDAPEEQIPITAEEQYLNQAYAGGVAETKDEEPDQSQLLRNQQQDQPKQILEPIQPEPTITQELQEEEEIPLVKKKKTKKAEEPPIIQPEPEPTIIEPIQTEPEPPIIQPEPEPHIIEPTQEDQQLVLYEPPTILKPVENPPTILQPKQEDQPLVVYEPQKIKGSSSTATQQNIGQSDSSIPLPFLRPVNIDRLSNVFRISEKPLTPIETREMRQNRIAIFDKKPDNKPLIDPKSTFTETIEDANKPSFVNPKKKEDSLKGVGAFIQGSPIKSEQPSKISNLLKKSLTTEATSVDKSADESRDVGVSLEGKDAFLEYIKQDYRKVPNKTLGNILITNGIKDPISGNDFYISPAGTVLIRNTKSETAKNRTYLSELLRKEYKPGFIY